MRTKPSRPSSDAPKRPARPGTKASPSSEKPISRKPKSKIDAKQVGLRGKAKTSVSDPALQAKTAKPSDPVAQAKVKRALVGLETKKYINCYLSLGSNIENRRDNLRAAMQLIHKNIGKITRESKVYETQPWGKTKQDQFLNMVIMVNTTLQPREILEEIAKIEKELGRTRTEKWGPRTVDVDILFYGKRVIRDKGLEIPHPEIENRAFVLVPLIEIAPELEHPTLHKQIDEIYMACTDLSEVVMLDVPL